MPDLDEILPLLWRRPEYRHAWSLAMEHPETRRPLVERALRHVPSDWATLAFLDNNGGDEFVVLFTHDFNNVEARRNEARTTYALGETGALRVFGAEGASGEIDLHRFRQFPDRDAVAMTADYLFRENKISPLVLTMFVTTPDLMTWGLEDPYLYNATRTALLEHKPEYSRLIERRAPVLVENLLLTMGETGERIAGATLSSYNFWRARGELRRHGVSCAGVEATSYGPNTRNYIDDIRENVNPTSPLAKMFRDGDLGASEDERRDAYRRWFEQVSRNSR